MTTNHSGYWNNPHCNPPLRGWKWHDIFAWHFAFAHDHRRGRRWRRGQTELPLVGGHWQRLGVWCQLALVGQAVVTAWSQVVFALRVASQFGKATADGADQTCAKNNAITGEAIVRSSSTWQTPEYCKSSLQSMIEWPPDLSRNNERRMLSTPASSKPRCDNINMLQSIMHQQIPFTQPLTRTNELANITFAWHFIDTALVSKSSIFICYFFQWPGVFEAQWKFKKWHMKTISNLCCQCLLSINVYIAKESWMGQY